MEFSSIENKGTVEVFLINNNNLYEIEKFDLLKINNNKMNNKNWGNYNIYTIKNLIILNINDRFKEILEKYLEYCIKENLVNNYIFQIILMNAEINYHNYPYQKIDWNEDW